MVELVSDTFAGHVGEKFEVTPQAGQPFETVLSSCDETRYGDHAGWREDIGRVPFSLIFVAPGGELVPQGIFSLRHADLGDFELFLVPLGPNADGGMTYEAVIN